MNSPQPGDSRQTAGNGLRFALLVWLALRLVLSLWGAVRLWMMPADVENFIRSITDGVPPAHDLYGYLVGLWDILDTQRYYTIAQVGYTVDAEFNSAFFPGYPILIRLVSFLLLGDSLLAALVVANGAAIVFFWYLYRLVALDYDEAAARRAVVWSAIFPSSFFLLMGYTEAPLLAFMVMAFYYARQNRWGAAGLLTAGAALIKQPGVFLIVPLAYMYWSQRLRGRSTRTLLQQPNWLWLLAAPIATVAFTLYIALIVRPGQGGVMYVSQQGSYTIPGKPLIDALLVIRSDNPLLALHLSDLAFAVLMLVLVTGVVIKLKNIPYTLYALILLLASLSLSLGDGWLRPLTNMPRRVLIIFPIFIYLATLTTKPIRFLLWAGLSFALFIGLSGAFVYWVFIS